ncbi:hypothetical protein BDV96DRAFT_641465 [Lophiotrema nucula]|uniref:Uncharacterized protein n=1 Tax=Lophiotrema nucula TaxID=690887 RepID=A0A6A5ZRD6_9PLEO|nr:hypothetical protein BDV96DRAFT_641465 [Lophiotrema nucula]
MPPQPLSFGSQEYWDKRFTSNSNPFEWLEAPTALDPYIVEAIKHSSEAQPDLLHIGCGTTINIGKQREVDIFDVAEGGNSVEDPAKRTSHEQRSKLDPVGSAVVQKAPSHMCWSAANLLSRSSLLEACEPATYSVIVDKSTSDSIACADDIYVPLPYELSTRASEHLPSKLSQSMEPIHPLHILAIHMALLARPKARWVALSYFADRYPFLHQHLSAKPNSSPKPAASCPSEPAGSSAHPSNIPVEDEEYDDEDEFDGEIGNDLDDIPQAFIDSGLPESSVLWRLLGKYEIEAPNQEPSNGNNCVAHRPKVLHWIYVLERTDVELFIRQSYEAAN